MSFVAPLRRAGCFTNTRRIIRTLGVDSVSQVKPLLRKMEPAARAGVMKLLKQLQTLTRTVTQAQDRRRKLESGLHVTTGYICGHYLKRIVLGRSWREPTGMACRSVSVKPVGHGVGSEDGRRLQPLYRRSVASLDLSHPWVDSTAAIDDAVDVKFLSLEKSLDDWTTSSSDVVPTARQCVAGLPTPS